MRRVILLSITGIVLRVCPTSAFSVLPCRTRSATLDAATLTLSSTSSKSETSSEETLQQQKQLRLEAASKFKILTCSSTSCAKKRQVLNIDEYATFGAFFSRIKDSDYANEVTVEESPCLGACKNAPCVAIEHEDYIGPVALEGMNQDEFSDRW